MTQTAAGTKLAMSVAHPATEDAAGYAALTWTVIGNIEQLGAIGAAFEVVNFQPLDGPLDKLKGPVNYGTLSPTIGHDPTDAGQTMLRTAADDTTNLLFSFQVTYQDGAKRYSQGRVFGYPENTGPANTVLTATPQIELTKKVVKVAGP
jgi:hypothetical protein